MTEPTTAAGIYAYQAIAIKGLEAKYTRLIVNVEREAAAAERERLRARNRDDIARFLAGMDPHELATRALLHDYADWLLTDPEPTDA